MQRRATLGSVGDLASSEKNTHLHLWEDMTKFWKSGNHFGRRRTYYCACGIVDMCAYVHLAECVG